jgi:hypothetical protein
LLLSKGITYVSPSRKIVVISTKPRSAEASSQQRYLDVIIRKQNTLPSQHIRKSKERCNRTRWVPNVDFRRARERIRNDATGRGAESEILFEIRWTQFGTFTVFIDSGCKWGEKKKVLIVAQVCWERWTRCDPQLFCVRAEKRDRRKNVLIKRVNSWKLLMRSSIIFMAVSLSKSWNSARN